MVNGIILPVLLCFLLLNSFDSVKKGILLLDFLNIPNYMSDLELSISFI